jgi:N-acetylmuramic acid 6-phosphate etherase
VRRSPEGVHPAADRVDRPATAELLRLMHLEDRRAVREVGRRLDEIAIAADLIADRLQAGGRLHYFGAGSSGRLAALDASECAPTFGVPEGTVVAHLAADGAGEDAADQGVAAAAVLSQADAAVGISASGETAYVVAALRVARERSALTVALTSAEGSTAAGLAELAIVVVTGPEVVAGSTRLKAGTAQKLVLNMLSTAAFTRLGKTYRGRMVDLVAANEKLRRRAVRLVSDLAGATPAAALAALEASGWSSRTALSELGVDLEGATAE